jgi:hypothetical protein
MFSRVYVPSPLWLQSSSSQNFNWPIGRARILADDFSNRLARAVAIHSNKISLSTNERYSLRRELIIDRDIPLDTFGEGWDWHLFKRTIEATKAFRTLETQNSNVLIPLSRYLNFKPIVDRSFKGDKVERMRKYLVSIVIENDPSYVSEKIWDAFNAETVPIFIGPSLKYFGIPDGLAIECEANKEAVISQLQGSLRMLEDLHQRYLRIRDFKESHNWRSRENVTVLGNLASSISKWFHS